MNKITTIRKVETCCDFCKSTNIMPLTVKLEKRISGDIEYEIPVKSCICLDCKMSFESEEIIEKTETQFI